MYLDHVNIVDLHYLNYSISSHDPFGMSGVF